MPTSRVAAGLIVLLWCTGPGLVAEESIDYLSRVKPILTSRCFSCHGALKQEAGLRLDTVDAMRRGGDSGAAIQPGDADASLVIERISAEDEFERMPPEGAPLTAEEIALISAWIRQGASNPLNEQPEADPREHWAFQRVVRPPVPEVGRAGWGDNPIDRFIGAAHEREGLEPASAASKEVLLRRVYLDLIGLPPTRADLRQFLADDAPDAYERVVGRLLESPQHGERWARHWMDVWRYSDWYGRRSVNDVRNSYPHVWRWRDWIVRSLNEDKGYDRMLVEMLASDEVVPEQDEAVAATGFIVRNWFALNYDRWMKDLVEHTGKAFLGLRFNCAHCHDHKYDPISQEEYFQFRAFFEPLELRHDRVPEGPAVEKFVAFHEGGPNPRPPIEAGLARVFDKDLNAETFLHTQGDPRNRPERPPIPPGVPAALREDQLEIEPVALPAVAWYPGLKPYVRQNEREQHSRTVQTAQAALDDARTALAMLDEAADASNDAAADRTPDGDAETTEVQPAGLEAMRRIARLRVARHEAAVAAARAKRDALEARIAADDCRYLGAPGDADALARAAFVAENRAAWRSAQQQLAAAELSRAEAVAAAHANPEDAQKAEAAANSEQQVGPARAAFEAAEAALDAEGTEYTPLSPLYPERSTGRRRALARWIASSDNPLTARVAVNHIWMRHFGQPLVETVFDFGRAGAHPTHPELLDWLAAELTSGTDAPGKAGSEWRMKRLHRLIVTSRTYRLAAQRTGTDGSDPDNRFLTRYPRRRAEAEVIRDSVLAAAGILDLEIGGPELDTGLNPQPGRRSLYFTVYPEEGGQIPFAGVFDAPDPNECYRRSDTVVPQQALAMTNSRLLLDNSRRAARRLVAELAEDGIAAESRDAFITVAFEQLLSRVPSAEERGACEEFLEKQVALYRSVDPQDLAATASAEAAPAVSAAADPELRARESLVRALFSHHDFVTIP